MPKSKQDKRSTISGNSENVPDDPVVQAVPSKDLSLASTDGLNKLISESMSPTGVTDPIYDFHELSDSEKTAVFGLQVVPNKKDLAVVFKALHIVRQVHNQDIRAFNNILSRYEFPYVTEEAIEKATHFVGVVPSITDKKDQGLLFAVIQLTSSNLIPAMNKLQKHFQSVTVNGNQCQIKLKTTTEPLVIDVAKLTQGNTPLTFSQDVGFKNLQSVEIPAIVSKFHALASIFPKEFKEDDRQTAPFPAWNNNLRSKALNRVLKFGKQHQAVRVPMSYVQESLEVAMRQTDTMKLFCHSNDEVALKGETFLLDCLMRLAREEEKLKNFLAHFIRSFNGLYQSEFAGQKALPGSIVDDKEVPDNGFQTHLGKIHHEVLKNQELLGYLSAYGFQGEIQFTIAFLISLSASATKVFEWSLAAGGILPDDEGNFDIYESALQESYTTPFKRLNVSSMLLGRLAKISKGSDIQNPLSLSLTPHHLLSKGREAYIIERLMQASSNKDGEVRNLFVISTQVYSLLSPDLQQYAGLVILDKEDKTVGETARPAVSYLRTNAVTKTVGALFAIEENPIRLYFSSVGLKVATIKHVLLGIPAPRRENTNFVLIAEPHVLSSEEDSFAVGYNVGSSYPSVNDFTIRDPEHSLNPLEKSLSEGTARPMYVWEPRKKDDNMNDEDQEVSNTENFFANLILGCEYQLDLVIETMVSWTYKSTATDFGPWVKALEALASDADVLVDPTQDKVKNVLASIQKKKKKVAMDFDEGNPSPPVVPPPPKGKGKPQNKRRKTKQTTQ